jgi:hypothetical protein
LTLLRNLAPARRLIPLVALATALLALPGQAHASKTQESIFQEDGLLQNFGSVIQSNTLDAIHQLGVNTLHVTVDWHTVAPTPTSGSIPAGFHGSDPADPQYNEAHFHAIDEIVRGAASRGMGVILVPTSPMPKWATGKDCTTSEKRRAPAGTCRPNPALYGDFVTALAKRYSGSFVDAQQTDDTTPIPRVSRWGLWNEPNLSSWIYPSQVRIRGKRVPVSAKIYRALVYAGGNALRRNGHANDQILLGETAPIGQGSSRTSPIDFYHALFCLDGSGRRLKGAAAKNLGCTGRFKPLPVTGVAHHPYTKGAAQPPITKQHSNDVTIANIPALQRVLAQGAHAKAITSSAAKRIYITEFGVSSTPPAKPRQYGVSLAKQAAYINQAEYIAYQNPAIRSIAQFQLQDDKFAAGSVLGKLTFQTGLEFTGGKPKPSMAAYKTPLWVVDRGKRLTIWGGVRGGSSSVRLLNNGKLVRMVRLHGGFFTLTIKKRKGTWQLNQGFFTSRVATPVKPGH